MSNQYEFVGVPGPYPRFETTVLEDGVARGPLYINLLKFPNVTTPPHYIAAVDTFGVPRARCACGNPLATKTCCA